MAQIAANYEVHPNMVTKCKKELQDKAARIFGKDHIEKKKEDENLVARLYQQEMGQLKVERDFIDRALGR